MIRKAAKRLAQTLQMTKFAMAPMIPVSAKVGSEAGPPRQAAAEGPAAAGPGNGGGGGGGGGAGGPGGGVAAAARTLGIEDLKAQLVASVPQRGRRREVRGHGKGFLV
jgi:hypothetical protein